MLQRDYFLKYLETFSKAIGEVVSRRKNNRYDEALKVINAAFETDAEAEELNELSLDDFLERVDYMEDFDARKWVLAAELLFEKAEIFEEMEQPEESAACFVKTLHLVLEALLSDPETYRPREISRVEEVVGRLDEDELPERTKKLLEEWRFFFGEGLGRPLAPA
jgi:tetratricopeptide (TPR) repeat protein